jgi:hypothetical protein
VNGATIPRPDLEDAVKALQERLDKRGTEAVPSAGEAAGLGAARILFNSLRHLLAQNKFELPATGAGHNHDLDARHRDFNDE